MKLLRIFSKAPSTAGEVENFPQFSACFLKNKPKTGNERLCFQLAFKTLNSFNFKR